MCACNYCTIFCEFYHTNVGSRHQIKTIHTVPLTSSAWLMIGLRHELSYISFCVIRARAKIFGCPPVVSLSSHDNRETPLSETNVLVRFIETVLLSKILRIQIGIIRDYQIVLPWEKSIWDLIHILLEGSTLLHCQMQTRACRGSQWHNFELLCKMYIFRVSVFLFKLSTSVKVWNNHVLYHGNTYI